MPPTTAPTFHIPTLTFGKISNLSKEFSITVTLSSIIRTFLVLKCWTGVYSNTPNLQRVHYVSLIKLSLAPIPRCVHRVEQRLRKAFLFMIKRKPVFLLLQMLDLTASSWTHALLDVKHVRSLCFNSSETERFYFKSLI